MIYIRQTMVKFESNFINLGIHPNSRFWWKSSSADRQYSGNICWVFPQCCNIRDIQGTFREHFKGKYFLEVLSGKVVFVLKVYDLKITNVDLLANSSNHEVMFPEYSRNIPQISVSKIFQGYPRNIVKLWKYF